MPQTCVILGPPGTGKTRAGVEITKGWISAGVGPDEVAYLAFTRAAAREAAVRIMGSLPKEWGEHLPYFRTIHSLAYRGMMKERTGLRVVTPADMKGFSDWSDFQGLYALGNWEDLSEIYLTLEARSRNGGRTRWDDCLTAYTLSRIVARTPDDLEGAKVKMAPLAARCMSEVDISQDLYREFVRKYEIYKQSNGLVDFTDMLEFALCEMAPLDHVRYLVVDELQDNCPLLFSICDRLFPNAESWLCGDPNQSIYRFSGADPGLFIERARKADHRIVLRRTHRFGQEVVEFSRKIIERADDRVLVDIHGVADRKHRIYMTGSFEPTVQKMLLLHRHVMGCQALAQAYIVAGLPFRNERGRDPLGSEKRTEGFMALEGLASGQEVTAGNAIKLVEDLMPSVLPVTTGRSQSVRLIVHGAKKRLQEGALRGNVTLKNMIDAKILTQHGADVVRSRDYRVFKYPEDFEYYHRVIENGYSLEGMDIPTITTIHGSKGRQAPAVTVFSEMGTKCWEDPSSEHRLAYVASTRTQGDLQICAERTVDWAEGRYDYPVGQAKPKEAGAPDDF